MSSTGIEHVAVAAGEEDQRVRVEVEQAGDPGLGGGEGIQRDIADQDEGGVLRGAQRVGRVLRQKPGQAPAFAADHAAVRVGRVGGDPGQRERGRDPLPFGVLSETVAAGTDFGNVSQRIPGIHPLIGVTSGPDVALHTREMTAAAGSGTGDTAAVDGAYGLAAVALDWLHDERLREEAQAHFEASGGAVDVVVVDGHGESHVQIRRSQR